MFTRKTRSTTDSRPQAEPARTRTRSSPLNKQKHSSLSKTFKPKNETISSKQPPKSTNASPHPKVMSKPVTPKKSFPRISGRSPAKNVRKENGSPAKPIQRSHFSRVASKKGNQNTSKPLTPKKCSVKTPPKKTVFQAASIVEKSPSHLRSTRSSAVSTSPSVSKEVVKVTPNRERAKLAVKTSPTKTLSQDTRKVEMSPVKTPSRSLRSPSDLLLSKSPSQSPSARKRLLSPPIQNVKIKKVGDMSQSKTNATISTECIDLCDSSNDSFKEMKSNCKGNKTHVLASSSEQNEPHATDSDPSLDESKLSGRFLRRKWFSLKAHGGFTCLRSAILSPEEVAKVVMQHNMVDTGKMHDVNFFTTKLMMRLSSRLPPVRARPSCEELVDLVNTKPTTTTVECPKESKGEGTAIRVKLEKRSFTDTITHLKNEPPKKVVSPGSPAKNTKLDSKISAVTRQADGTLTKKQERDIALQQLKNLRYL